MIFLLWMGFSGPLQEALVGLIPASLAIGTSEEGSLVLPSVFHCIPPDE
jgi:hypothetical protein